MHRRNLPADLVSNIISVFQDFRRLQCLELYVIGPLGPLLQESNFPELRALNSNVDISFSAALREFINRHLSLTSLDLFPTEDFVAEIGSISLPHLRNYTGPGRYASGLVVGDKSLETVTVIWEAEDPSLGPAWAALGACTEATISALALGTFCDRISAVDLLRCAAQNMPHLAIVDLHRMHNTADRMPLASTAPSF